LGTGQNIFAADRQHVADANVRVVLEFISHGCDDFFVFVTAYDEIDAPLQHEQAQLINAHFARACFQAVFEERLYRVPDLRDAATVENVGRQQSNARKYVVVRKGFRKITGLGQAQPLNRRTQGRAGVGHVRGGVVV